MTESRSEAEWRQMVLLQAKLMGVAIDYDSLPPGHYEDGEADFLINMYLSISDHCTLRHENIETWEDAYSALMQMSKAAKEF